MSNVRIPLEVNCLQVDHLVDGMPHSAKDVIASRNCLQRPALGRLQPKTAIYLQRVALAEALYIEQQAQLKDQPMLSMQ